MPEKEELKNLTNELEEIKSLLKEILEELETKEENEDIFKSYRLSDVDETGTTKYYGYLKKDGDWIIEQYNSTTGTRRFAKNDELIKRTEEEKDYKRAWENRASLQYFYFYEIF